ncbi:RelA/SpoT family protein [Porphyromonas pogonae]|uniref:RelA/SpoT family protein n=1 Tax=Porphyromonas pogonae TaxID=867595 RepID=UPI002E7AA265|nr:RelA/SpoT family protein [Porphyromonas pogonae]
MENNDNTQVNRSESELMIEREYKLLIQDYLNSNHRRKIEKIDKAFKLANEAHKGAKRRSGEPYILHPIAVARIVCKEMGLGSTSICCALLHDVVEDTEYSVEDIREMFGDKIAQIVDGLTKISGEVFSNTTSLQAENFRKLILTMNDDIRVILIKIADRLHNMRTLSSMLPAKQMKIAGETLYVYAPLAHRLGLFAIKSELEDLSFKYEYPEEFASIKAKICNTEERRQDLFRHFAEPLRKRFAQMGFQYEMKARVKSIYSIWKKMQAKAVPFEEIYDLFAVRIIFDSQPGYPDKNRCWDIYSAITDIYKNRPDRIRDWVSSPKSNGYQALHLTVMGPDGEWVEVQIRSRKMDDIAEKGFAAHWKYKSEGVEEDSELDKWLRTIQEILENPSPNAMDFLDTIKLNLFSGEIMVFTPRGDIQKLPIGATALDFAYSIHSKLGNHCIGAKVNHKLVPLSYVLSSGDQVEVLSSKNQLPTEEWLKYVTTAKAKSKVDAAIRKQRRDFTHKGEDKVVAHLEANKLPVTTANLDKIAAYYGFDKREDYFYGVGKEAIQLPDNLKKVFENAGAAQGNFLTRAIRTALNVTKNKTNETKPKEVIDTKKTYILTEDAHNLNYRVAPCCKPIPGDDAFGIIGEDGMIEVHKRSCPVAMRLKSSRGDKIVSTKWGEHRNLTFDVTLIIKGIDSKGILNAITLTLLEDFNVNIKEVSIKSNDGIFEGVLTILVQNTNDLNRIIQILQKNNSIISITRSTENR